MPASSAPPPRARIPVLAVLLAALLGVVGARLYVIQIIQHEHLGTRAEGQYERRIPVAAKRGTIYDRRGRVLVISLDAASVFAHPGLVQDPSATATRLARVLRVPVREIQAKLRSDQPFVWIQRQVDPEQAEAVSRLSLSGVGLVPEGKGDYPKKDLAAHLIGFAGGDNRGWEGLGAAEE